MKIEKYWFKLKNILKNRRQIQEKITIQLHRKNMKIVVDIKFEEKLKFSRSDVEVR